MASDSEANDRYEIAATVLLGVAAVIVAFASYQASLWGGIQDTAFNETVRFNNESIDSRQRADTLSASDQAIFLDLVFQWIESPTEDIEEFLSEDDIGGFILGNMTEDGADATYTWFLGFESDEAGEEIPPYPFDDLYFELLYQEGVDLNEEADLEFATATEANGHGDDYQLAATFLTMVFFFAGVSIVLNGDRLRLVLLLIGGVILAGSTIFVATLSRTF